MTPFSGVDWDLLEGLYDEALSLRPADREAFVSRLRMLNPRVGKALEKLLDASEPAERLFDSLGRSLFATEDHDGDPGDLIAEADPLLDTEVGPYRVERVVGRGGMGVVYQARHLERDATLALKFLPALGAASPEARRRFMAEATAAAAVDHPNVGQIFEVAESKEGRLYLAMPYYDGVSLRVRLRAGALPAAEALDWFGQAAAGLSAVHAEGIVHRDVTPGNLLRTTDGVVKLLDFGLAKLAEATLGTGGRPIGTTAYMSPEQLLGDTIDRRADWWSLGVVLYEMIYGERPFRGSTRSAIRDQILDGAAVAIPPLPQDVEPTLAELISSLLERNARDRADPAAWEGPRTGSRSQRHG